MSDPLKPPVGRPYALTSKVWATAADDSFFGRRSRSAADSVLASFRLRPSVSVAFLAAAILLLAFWFGFLHYRDLFSPDEGRYAEIPREMGASGDWVTPRLNGLKYLEKPALQYWVTAAVYEVFGPSAWAARLWVCLTGFLSMVLVFITGRRVGGTNAGWLAAFALISSVQFVVFGQILTLDMGVSFFLTVTLCALIGTLDRRLTPAARRGWALTMWGAMALAVLSKGLIGIVLPALVLVGYVLLQRDARFLRHLHWRTGAVCLAIVAGPWFWLVQARNPEFFDFFFVREHFRRFATGEAHRPGPWYLFLALLLVGSMPWTLAYLRGLRVTWTSRSESFLEIDPGRLLIVWVVVITAFFSLSSSKLPGYILPVYPALALLIAVAVARSGTFPRVPILETSLLGALALAGSFLLGDLPALHDPVTPEATLVLSWLRMAAVTLLGAALLAWRARRHVLRSWVMVALGSLLAVQLLVAGAQSFAPKYSGRPLVEAAEAASGGLAAGGDFFSVGTYEQTLPFLLGRRLIIVDYADELEFGLRQEPELGATRDQFRERWRQASQAFAILPVQELEQEKAEGLPFTELASNGIHTIIARRAKSRAEAFP